MRMTENKDFVFEIWRFVFTFFWCQCNLGLKLAERVHLLGGTKLKVVNVIVDLCVVIFNIINFNGLRSSSNEIRSITILGNFMIATLLFHVHVPQNCWFVEIDFVDSVRFAVVGLASKNYHCLWFFAFYDCRTFNAFIQLVSKLSPLTVSFRVSFDDSCSLIVPSASTK